ncbi:nuclear transport factor 2 family protein [Aquamicrobium sp.]|uniref:nuclear transport factor 2 family protein n=1 Tax=Aquamicrobium sp. TaxID=1872579 RepID=UPI002589896E|nr:nuclear transport factor 2 family protein [Aquamicrobium sp.]MCK9552499.1 nuclear transport factor 2 family protein [Aquamicrobium sp.]
MTFIDTADSATAYHCQNLLNLYALAQDTRDADLFAGLFAEDARWERPVKNAPVIGRAAIRHDIAELIRSRPETSRYQHIITNVICHSDEPGRAESGCYALVFSGDAGKFDELPPIALPAGILRYRTRFSNQEGGWRITFHRAERLFTPSS